MTRDGGTGARRAAALGAALLLAGCVGLERNPNVVGTFSDKLSPYNYKEEGELVRMIVGVDAARFIRKEAYFPLFVQVANRTDHDFTVTRESFTLEDRLGHQYPLAPARDVLENYPRLDLDRRLFRENHAVTVNGVGVFTYSASDFFPSSARTALRVDALTLPPKSYMEDVLYFPIPETGLNNVPLRLYFKVRELNEAIVVVFEVPRTLGMFEKEDPEAP
ncbi:MAG TPA: hypothetical protein VNL37_00300 [Candidatus Polarisedimenticolia bacterium]|nr:hypothetical protein [Candidatus Polarisedimenticolia bacterium]